MGRGSTGLNSELCGELTLEEATDLT